jgi:hypothetical protein
LSARLAHARRLDPPALVVTPRAAARARALSSGARTALVVLFLALFSYGYFYAPAAWNENSRFDVVRSIVERGRLDIDAYHDNTGDKAFFAGHYYSDKAPGTALLAVPSYALYYGLLWLGDRELPDQKPGEPGHQALTNQEFRTGLFVSSFFSVAMVSAMALLAFFALALRVGVDRKAATMATFAWGLGSLAFPYSTMLYGHGLCGSLLFLSFSSLVSQRLDQRWTARGCAIAGLCASYAVVTEYPAAIAALLLLGYALHASRSRRAVGWFVAGAMPPALILGAYNWICFGAPWALGYAHVADATFALGMSHGLMGLTYPKPLVLFALLFGSWRGLLWSCPIVLFAIGALVPFARGRWRDEACLCIAVVLFFLLLNSSYYMWWGGAALGPRHLIPMLPFALLPLARVPAGRWRTAALTLLSYSIVMMLVATAVGPEAPEDVDPVLCFHWSRFLDGHVAVNAGSSNLGVLIGLRGSSTVLPLVAVWLLVLVVLPRWAEEAT